MCCTCPFSYDEILYLQVHSRLPVYSVEVKINAEGSEVLKQACNASDDTTL
jgi:hypothetical protein